MAGEAGPGSVTAACMALLRESEGLCRCLVEGAAKGKGKGKGKADEGAASAAAGGGGERDETVAGAAAATPAAEVAAQCVGLAAFVATEMSKLAIYCSKGPLKLEDLEPLVGNAMRGILALNAACSRSTSPSSTRPPGLALQQFIATQHRAVVHGCCDVFAALHQANGPCGESHSLACGKLYAGCDAFKAGPADHVDALVRQLQPTQGLLDDCLAEVTDSIETEEWEDTDRPYLAPAQALVKVTAKAVPKLVALVKKCGNSSSNSVAAQDRISRAGGKLSAACDEVVMSLYSPLEPEAVLETALDVERLALEVSEAARQLLAAAGAAGASTAVAEPAWVALVAKVAQHNTAKIRALAEPDATEP